MKINYYIQENEKYLKISITIMLDKIEELTKKIENNNLVFTTIRTRKTTYFSKKDNLLTFLIKLKMVKQQQKKQKNKKINVMSKKKEEKKHTLADVNMLFNGRNDAIKFIESYGSMILEAKKKGEKKKQNKMQQDLKN